MTVVDYMMKLLSLRSIELSKWLFGVPGMVDFCVLLSWKNNSETLESHYADTIVDDRDGEQHVSLSAQVLQALLNRV